MLTSRVRILLLSLVVLSSTSNAQVSTGTILGTAKDQTGAVLPGTTISVRNVETGVSRTATSGTGGEYRFPALAAGNYEVQAELTGFQKGVRKGIVLTVGREAVVDFSLNVGDVAEQVTITGEAPLIETTTATVSGLVTPQQMRDIPLNSRSFLELVPLQTGAVFAEAADPSGVPNGFGKKLSIVGMRPGSNSFLLDGADMNNAAGVAASAAGTMAGVETVREFRVVTNAYDAEYGQHTGGVISAITKSGTNQIHGSAFEFLRNDNLDARNFFDRDPGNPLQRSNPPEFRRNQFGGTVGGPIRADRIFFFGSYEGTREGLGRTDTYNVPGERMRRGFLPLAQAACTQSGGTLQSEGCFLGVDSTIKPYLEAYPVPNTSDRADGTAQFVTAATKTTQQNLETVRIDYRLSNSDSIFGRFTNDNAELSDPGFNTILQLRSPSRYTTLEEAHIFSPALLGRTHFSFVRTYLSAFDVGQERFEFPKFSFADQPDVPGILTVTGLTGWGGSATNPKIHIQNTFQFEEGFYLTRSRHSLKFGGQVERFQFNQRSDFNSGGVFAFTRLQDFLRNAVDNASFVQPGSDNIRGWRQSTIGVYLQDDISVRQGLKLNLGLRYEFITSPREVNGKVSTIRDIAAPHVYQVTGSTTDVGDPLFLNPSLRNFAPRIGIAWSPQQDGRFSVRGGFGIFHEQLLPKTYVVSGVRMSPFYSVAQLFSRDGPVDFPNAFFTQRNTLVSSALGSKPQAEGTQWDLSQPMVMKWSLTLERGLGSTFTVSAGYSGTRGLHLLRGNLQLNSTPSEIRNGRRYILIEQPLPNPNFNRMRWALSDAVSDYHGLQLSMNKRFSHGFQFQSSYTLARSTDDASSWTGSNEFGSADLAGYRTDKMHGPSGFDVRQSSYTNFSYELPTGNLDGLAHTSLVGWSVSGVLRLNSGSPINLSATQPRLGTLTEQFVSGSTLDLIPGGDNNPARSQNPDQYFDVTQFSFPTPFFEGNLGRATLRVPGIANFDFTLMKDTPISWIGEDGSLQFRAEFFNLLNRPNFGDPATNLFDQNGVARSTAGQITTTRTASRQIQLALRLHF
jgi:hypothetical protein